MSTERPADDALMTRAVRVLEVLAGMEQPAGLTAVVERCRLPQTQVYRALRALHSAGWVDHTRRHGYRIGARGISLGTLLNAHPELREVARPALVTLARATSATVSFHLRSGNDRVLTLAAVPPSAPDRPAPAVPLGERAPLVRGCSGRAILAHLPVDQVEAVLDAHRDHSTAPDLRAELARIAREGYALSFADNHAHLNGVSVALVGGEDAMPLGSLSLSGEAGRLDRAALRELVGPLSRAAGRLAPRLAAVMGPAASARQLPLDVSERPGQPDR